MPVFSETAIQISGVNTPSISRVTIDCFTKKGFQFSRSMSSQCRYEHTFRSQRREGHLRQSTSRIRGPRKRQRTAAVEDAAAFLGLPLTAARFWTAAVLCRFSHPQPDSFEVGNFAPL